MTVMSRQVGATLLAVSDFLHLSGSAKVLLRHALCVAALMWMPLVNGQPFFFPDTTSYVRAADIAVYIGTGHRISTDWTAAYAGGSSGDLTRNRGHSHAGANDVRNGQIMSGRSPYIGAALYLGYITSNFWLFVVAQAALAYWLIRLTLRRFNISTEGGTTAIVLLIAGATNISYFNGLLLADGMASFGILAFLLLAADDGRQSRSERWGLWLVVAFSAVSHLTHIAMLLGMVVTLFGLQLLRFAPPNRRALLGGLACLAVGFMSTSLTSYIVDQVFHRPPQLVPLMTARFIADGPGTKFIRAGCAGKQFEVCRLHSHAGTSTAFLWSNDPKLHGYTTAAPEQRAEMSAEDTAFAKAVLEAYPAEQARKIVDNSASQVLTFGLDGLNTGCWASPQCWQTLPTSTRDALRHSLSGRNAWPERQLTMLLYVTVATSAGLLIVIMPTFWRVDPTRARMMTVWLLVGFAAMVVCAVLGGAVSEPQYRYQGRLVWLVVLFAVVTIVAVFRGRSADMPVRGLAALL